MKNLVISFMKDLFCLTTPSSLYNKSLGEYWGTSMGLDGSCQDKKLDLQSMEISTVQSTPVDIPMANHGMTKTPDGQNILALSQGFNSTGGAIYELDRSTYETTLILDTFYGKHFNTLNDIKVTNDGIIFFCDPVYAGFEQGFRYGNPELGGNVYRHDMASKTTTPVVIDLQRPNGVGLWDGRSQGEGCVLFLTDTGLEQAPAGPNVSQTPRGFNGFGDSSLYMARDDDGCFEPSSGPWSVQPLLPASAGVQDGVDVHASTESPLFFCDETGLWIWSIPLVRAIGLVAVGCTQVSLSQTMGLSTVCVLAETKIFSVEFNFNVNVVPVVDPSTTNSSSPVFPLSLLFLAGVATTITALLYRNDVARETLINRRRLLANICRAARRGLRDHCAQNRE